MADNDGLMTEWILSIGPFDRAQEVFLSALWGSSDLNLFFLSLLFQDCPRR